ncbi:sigma-70 family RNA polymerase sigma factor [Pseudonocardia broussonetiae]|uniref:Sigma-70 family RNA polymerase sigma factor n=1 Tax=Pseudonocardia broussonetiae TaxID=2736640 RepID=A0A6M6JEX6_9PSEU|nr:sigma-70 family RNA polymerase sigma factor [Pseudonocardia broussonetiae]QJY45021.1 sigma-70 family RNA polymerase sigma factor [Pseudonocardia broussonetiae]
MQDDDSSEGDWKARKRRDRHRGDDHEDLELEDLARLAGAGDRAALDQFLRRIRSPVIRFCRSKLLGSIGAQGPDDVAQEVLLAVCEALPRFRPDGSSVMAFVFGIARFKLVDAFRAGGRDRSVPSDALPEAADDDPGTEHAAVLSTEIVRLRLAMDQLLPHHREVIGLRVAMGYSGAEVAALLGTTPGAVRVTQHRAMARLRVLLADAAVED